MKRRIDMGSSGKGDFGAYIPREDVCPKEIVFNVQDIDISEYYLNKATLPNVGSNVSISNTLVNKRLVVIDLDSGLILGNVPVEYNFLFSSCLNKGREYIGTVKHTNENPYNIIMVELHVE